MKLKLVKADASEGSRYAEQVMAYREEMLANGDTLDGCGGLRRVTSFAEWIDFDERLRAIRGKRYSPTDVYLVVRCSDNRLVGMLEYRRFLNEFLLKFGGNVGYSVRPSERRKGYATEMLRMLLLICREDGQCKILVTCLATNEASRKVILANGGVFESEIVEVNEKTGQSNPDVILQRYWITLD